MNSKKSVEEFLSQKSFALIGVSRKKSKFGNIIYRELKQKGYKIYPVNRYIDVFDGDKCFPDLMSLPEKVNAVIINVPPAEALKVLSDAETAGIKNVWLQQGSESAEAVKFCEEKEINCISNECILMFAQPSAFIHRAHKWIWGVLGKLPA